MKLQPATQTLSILVGALVILSLTLDEQVLLIFAYLLIAFLGIRAITFFLPVRHLARSVEMKRIVQRQILRQGGIIPVSIQILCRVPLGMSVTFRELIPPGTRIARGTQETTLPVALSHGELSIHYDLQIFSRGDLVFGGLQMEVKDDYYADTIHLGRTPFRSPTLHSRPAVAFASEVSHSELGSLEVARIRAIQGQGVRSFRPFQTGDDPRAIDWKLSAKHGKTILREYMGQVGGSPLFLLDLPSEIGDDPSRWDRLVSALTAHIEKAIREFSRTDIVVLSGGRIIRTLSLRRDPRLWYRMLATLPPGEGYLPLYRHPFPLILASLHRAAEKSAAKEGITQPFASRLASITAGFRAVASPTLFEKQLVALFDGNQERELFIFSLFQGDLSHLRAAILLAREYRLPAHLRLTAHSAIPAQIHALSNLGVTTVEVLA